MLHALSSIIKRDTFTVSFVVDHRQSGSLMCNKLHVSWLCAQVWSLHLRTCMPPLNSWVGSTKAHRKTPHDMLTDYTGKLSSSKGSSCSFLCASIFHYSMSLLHAACCCIRARASRGSSSPRLVSGAKQQFSARR